MTNKRLAVDPSRSPVYKKIAEWMRNVTESAAFVIVVGADQA